MEGLWEWPENEKREQRTKYWMTMLLHNFADQLGENASLAYLPLLEYLLVFSGSLVRIYISAPNVPGGGAI